MKSVFRRIGTAAAVSALAWPGGAFLPARAAAATSVQVAQTAPPVARPAPRATAPAAAGDDRRGQPNAPAQSAQAPAAQGQPPQPAPQPVPVRTEILNFENWVVTCNEFAEGARTRVCSAALQIVQPNSNQVVFNWTIALDTSKQLVAVVQTPTGVLIPPGVELRVGKAALHKIPFASCDTGRCIATMPMDNALLREMSATPTAEAVVQGSQGNTVTFTIQLRGFDKAYAVLSRS